MYMSGRLTKTGPLAELLSVGNLDEGDLVLGAESDDELLVGLLLAGLVQDTHVSLAAVEGLGSLAETAGKTVVHESELQDTLEGVKNRHLALGGIGRNLNLLGDLGGVVLFYVRLEQAQKKDIVSLRFIIAVQFAGRRGWASWAWLPSSGTFFSLEIANLECAARGRCTDVPSCVQHDNYHDDQDGKTKDGRAEHTILNVRDTGAILEELSVLVWEWVVVGIGCGLEGRGSVKSITTKILSKDSHTHTHTHTHTTPCTPAPVRRWPPAARRLVGRNRHTKRL